MLSSALVSAVPAKRGVWQTLRLADGTEVRAELVGDEFCHYWKAGDGTGYVRQDSTEFYVAADVSRLALAGSERRSAVNKARMSKMKKAVGEPSHYTGKKKGLIILVSFPDKPFADGHTSDLYKRIANEEGFTHDLGFKGSVYDYFKAQSGGQFEFTFDVVGPYEMPNSYKYYGKDYGGVGVDQHLGKLIGTACEYADADVDFSDYDWDGDGEVDQVFVLYAGQGQAAGGDANTVWPQAGKLSGVGSDQAPVTLDGVKVDTYACSCELGQFNTIDGIGTICHEFSHCFGLPDMYDTGSFGSTTRKYGMYTWSLMDMGNYLDNGFTPAGYTAYEQMFCGWRQLVELSSDADVTDMKPLSDGGNAYIIYNDNHRDEYYILENRQPVGWDAALPGHGLLVVHVDYDKSVWEANKVNTYSERCTVIPADNSRGWEDGDAAGDAYPYSGNNSLTNTSVPAAAVNNANADGSMLMNKQITGITQNADGTVAFRFVNSAVGTGITTVPADGAGREPSRVYGLDGRCFGTASGRLPRGIYVIDGKKVVR